MSKNYGSEVHALWACSGCGWVRENVVELPAGRDWLNWSVFEQDERPNHHCRGVEKGKPFLRAVTWFER